LSMLAHDDALRDKLDAAVELAPAVAVERFDGDDHEMAMWLLGWGAQQVEAADGAVRNLQQKLTTLGATAGVAVGLWLNAAAVGQPPASWALLAAFFLAGLCFAAAVALGLVGARVVTVASPAEAADWWAYLIAERAATTRQELLCDLQLRTRERDVLAHSLAERVRWTSVVLAVGLSMALIAGIGWILESL